MLVIIGPHSLNTLQARVIGMIWYPDDVMGGSDDPPDPPVPEPLFSILLDSDNGDSGNDRCTIG
jgi:hypothetical protein